MWRSLVLSYNLGCYIRDPHSIPVSVCAYTPLMIIRKDFRLVFLQAVPTSKGQALADEYGIKFFETVSANMLLDWNRHCFICYLLFIPRVFSAECQDKFERGGGLLFNCEGYQAKDLRN